MIECQSCGMPMKSLDDYSHADKKSIYCSYCTQSNGKIRPFEEIKKSLISFYMSANPGKNKFDADTAVVAHLKLMPAWKDHFVSMDL